jgi:ribose 5-phosphate isomerase
MSEPKKNNLIQFPKIPKGASVQSLVDELGAEVERECRRIYAVSSTEDTREKVKAALGISEAGER